MSRLSDIVVLAIALLPACTGDSTDTGATTTSTGTTTTETTGSGTGTTSAKQDMGMAGPSCEELPSFGPAELMQFDGCEIDLTPFECPRAQVGCAPLPEGAADCSECVTGCVDFPGACPDDTPPSGQCGPLAIGDDCCFVWVVDMPCG